MAIVEWVTNPIHSAPELLFRNGINRQTIIGKCDIPRYPFPQIFFAWAEKRVLKTSISFVHPRMSNVGLFFSAMHITPSASTRSMREPIKYSFEKVSHALLR